MSEINKNCIQTEKIDFLKVLIVVTVQEDQPLSSCYMHLRAMLSRQLLSCTQPISADQNSSQHLTSCH